MIVQTRKTLPIFISASLLSLVLFNPPSSAKTLRGLLAIVDSVPAVTENFALASKGATVSASSTYNGSFPAQAANDGDRAGNNWGAGGGWNDSSPGQYPDYIEVHFASLISVSEVDVFSLQDNPGSPANPTAVMTFSQYGLTDFKIQYDVGGVWTDIAGASTTGNNLVWKKFTFAPLTTSRIRLYITGASDGQSRLAEIEAWGVAAGALPIETRTNVALASNSATATASSSANGSFPPSSAIDGDRLGSGWGSGGGWQDATQGAFPDWLQIDFNGSKTIGEIDVFTLQDTLTNPQVPIDTMTFANYGLKDFEVQYWNGSAWVAIPGGTVTGNSLVWRKFTFASINTAKIRIFVTAVSDNYYSRITEIEAWTP